MSNEGDVGNNDGPVIKLLLEDIALLFSGDSEKGVVASPAAFGEAKGLSGRLCSKLQ